MTSRAAPRILIVRFSSIGDLLLTTPLLRALRRRHPDADITFVTRADMADTLRSNERLTRLVTWERGSPLLPLARTLRQEQWTHRLDLHGSLRSLFLRQLVGGRWNGYPKHRARRRALIRSHGKEGGVLEPIAERYFAAARDLDVTPDGGPAEFPVAAEARAVAEEFRALHGLGNTRPLVALAPGAAHFTKRWPLDHWIQLARQLSATTDLVILGGPAEADAASRIAVAAGPGAASAAGLFRLDGTAALLAQSAALIAGDTGVLHLATAVGTPVAGIYGPTIEAFGFFPYRARAVTIQRDLWCRPCSSQGGPVCPLGHHHCLTAIVPDEVAAALGSLVPRVGIS